MKDINKKLKYINFRNNGTFLIAAIVNSTICFSLFGTIGGVFGVITTLFSNIVYDAKPDSSNIFYIFFLLCLVIVGGGIGFLLKLTIYFYIYLFILSYCYYLFYKKDDYLDRTFPFLIIFSCMGTTLDSISIDLPMAYLSGVAVSLVIFSLLKHKNNEIHAFKNGLFSKAIYHSDEKIYIRAFFFSFFLFLSLSIPDYLNLYKPYWAPLTFIMLLHPKEMNIIKVTLLRFLGSLLAAAFVITMFSITKSKETYIYLSVLALTIFFIPTFFRLDYMLKTFSITVFVLLLLEETLFLHNPTYLLPISRVYETFIGGVVAILASLVLNIIRIIKKRKITS
ncbi:MULTISPECIES: FUSC family protein [Providencia]|uniref:FUSC family protein n=1 Tax=Providencia TaxID=586 RepID=UPI0015EBF57B|nr:MULTISPECIES: FUSC family protein [Providencia]ELR5138610.1 FUSC family protein [Providencia rettgeri]ELR5169742.1 FUSC family protein [Providencia rettgeri]QLQ94683.1 FUSC family protein [Providencia rettgeri]WEB85281.1 FUSC family protein [Providencia rettgeri]HCH7936497.1 FUSC family protein [Providencia rettgeri]